MDYDKVRTAITPHTKAIVPVDLGGVPCDYDKIFSIVTDPEVRIFFIPLEADESDDGLTKLGSRIQKNLGRVAVVADGAHALGAHRFVSRSSSDPEGRGNRKDQMVGSIADFTSFSFHAVKNFTTAEGGAATEPDEILKGLNLILSHYDVNDFPPDRCKGLQNLYVYRIRMAEVTGKHNLPIPNGLSE